MLRVLNVRLSRCTVIAQLMRVSLPPLVTPRVLGVDDFAPYGDPPGRRHHPSPAQALGGPGRRTAQQMAPCASRSRDRLPRRLPHLPAGHSRRSPGRSPGQRPFSLVAGPVPARSGSRRRPPRLPSGRAPCPRTGRSAASFADHRPRAGHARRSARSAAFRGRPRADRCRPLLQRRGSRARAGPPHRPQIRQGPQLARGDAPPSPPPVSLGSVPRLPATTLGRGRTQRQNPPPRTRWQGLPWPLPTRESGPGTAATRPAPRRARQRPPSPREAARWIIASPVQHGPQTAERLRRLLDHCPELQRTHELVRQFAAMLDTRDATPLPAWLDHLTNSGLPPLAGIATALREDRHAVTQGITSPHNSGVNEGRITDVKLQKSIMAGRAVPLLRHRVVLVAHLRRRYADQLTTPSRRQPDTEIRSP
ncbi:transposase [Streptomyces sp. NPDC055254]